MPGKHVISFNVSARKMQAGNPDEMLLSENKDCVFGGGKA